MEIQSSVHDVDAVTKEIRATVPAETVAIRINQSMTKLATNVRLKGFRPGKAPRELLEKIYGSRLSRDVAAELVEEALRTAVREHSLRVVGEPSWSELPEIDQGQELSFSATVHILPEPVVTGHDAFDVTAEKQEVSEEQIDKAIEALREQHHTTAPVEGRELAEKGDFVEFSAQAYFGGKKVRDAEEIRIQLGKDSIPPEVEAAIPTIPLGSKKKVAVRSRQLPRKARGNLEYEITLTSIGQKVLPEVNDEFAKIADSSVENVAQLRDRIRERLQARFDAQARERARSEILNQLVERNKFDVPPPMVDREIEHMARQMMGQSNKLPSVDVLRTAFGEVAADRIRAQLLVDQIAKLENLKAALEEISAAVAEQARSIGQPTAVVERWVASSPDRRAAIESEVIRTKVLDLLESRATIQYKAPNVPQEETAVIDEKEASESE